MKVDKPKELTGLDRAPPLPERGAAKPRTDRVSIEEARQAAEVVKTVQAAAGTSRTARLEKLEAAIRSGNYTPDAGRLAEQLLSQAEIDARIRAMLAG